MSDYPSYNALPLFVSTWSRWGGLEVCTQGGQALVSITWPSANLAKYVPVAIPWPYLVKRVFWINGSSVTSTNMDFGIYTAEGTKIYSTGSTAASGTSATQYVTPATDILLTPGRYYFALASSSGSANRGGQGSTSTNVIAEQLGGMLQEASALPLPATMTPVTVANSAFPLCGVTRTASGF